MTPKEYGQKEQDVVILFEVFHYLFHIHFLVQLID